MAECLRRGRGLATAGSLLVAALVALTACGGNASVASTPAASGAALAVPTNAVATAVTALPTYPGKPGEIYPPTPYPPGTVVVTPFPPDGDKEFYFTPVAPPNPTQPIPPSSAPYNQQIFASQGPPNVQQATSYSDLVVQGAVTQVLTARWTTADGKRPANPHAADNRDSIYTPVLIRLTKMLKGQVSQPEIVVSTIGGTVGLDSVEWGSDTSQTFKQGDNVVLFLGKPGSFPYVEPLTNELGRTVWHAYIRFDVTTDGQAINVRSTLPLADLINEINKAQGR